MKLLSQKCRTPEAAIRIIKNYYTEHCIITGQFKPGNLAGCHFKSRSTHPEYKSIPALIVPLVSEIHTNGNDTFDWILFGLEERNFESKLEWLSPKVADDFKIKYFVQIQVMMGILKKDEK